MQKVRSHPLRGSYCLYACGFRIYFTPLPGFFSPFLHSTGSLSVDYEYLALEDGPPSSDRISRAPPYLTCAQFHRCLFAYGAITHYGRPFQTVPLRLRLKRTGWSDFARHYFLNLG